MLATLFESPLGLVPPLSDSLNHYDCILNNPQLPKLPEDFVAFIDGITGEQRTHGEFLKRVASTSNALGSNKAHGGLGLKGGGSRNGEMVGILSDDCLVSCHALT